MSCLRSANLSIEEWLGDGRAGGPQAGELEGGELEGGELEWGDLEVGELDGAEFDLEREWFEAPNGRVPKGAKGGRFAGSKEGQFGPGGDLKEGQFRRLYE